MLLPLAISVSVLMSCATFDTYLAEGDYEEARAAANRLGDNPSRARAYLALARKAAADDELGVAFDAYLSAFAVAPQGTRGTYGDPVSKEAHDGLLACAPRLKGEYLAESLAGVTWLTSQDTIVLWGIALKNFRDEKLSYITTPNARQDLDTVYRSARLFFENSRSHRYNLSSDALKQARLEIFSNLGDAYFLKGRRDTALTCYDDAGLPFSDAEKRMTALREREKRAAEEAGGLSPTEGGAECLFVFEESLKAENCIYLIGRDGRNKRIAIQVAQSYFSAYESGGGLRVESYTYEALDPANNNRPVTRTGTRTVTVPVVKHPASSFSNTAFIGFGAKYDFAYGQPPQLPDFRPQDAMIVSGYQLTKVSYKGEAIDLLTCDLVHGLLAIKIRKK
ncbi:MAG TPA: hypothetical protein P5133_08255 [Spirochaetia bacterium]|nr:hypothetical protein [Spirochaetia bacterium]